MKSGIGFTVLLLLFYLWDYVKKCSVAFDITWLLILELRWVLLSGN